MKTTTKRAVGKTMYITLLIVLYITLFCSACGILVERGWEFGTSLRAMAIPFVGFPALCGYAWVAVYLQFSDVKDP